MNSARPEEFTLKIRLPWWISDTPEITINGEPQPVACAPSSYVELRRTWGQDEIHVKLPKKLSAVPLPDEPDTYAFMEGPVVLAGLNPGGDALARTLHPVAEPYHRPISYPIDGLTLNGNPDQPETFLTPENEREWIFWQGSFRTRGQAQNIRFIPLHQVRDEIYTVYFPIKP